MSDYKCLDCNTDLGKFKAYMRCNICYVQWYMRTGTQCRIMIFVGMIQNKVTIVNGNAQIFQDHFIVKIVMD